MKRFISKERSEFFEKSGLPPFWDTYYELEGAKVDYPYMLYTCHKESEQRMHEIQEASVKAAEIFELVSNRVYTWNEKEFEKWGFPKHHKELLRAPREEIFCMRIGWALKDGHPVLFEINAEAPTIWIEPETAGPMLIKQFGLRDPNPKSNIYLKKTLNQAIKKSLEVLAEKKKKNPTIGFICYDDMEEIMTMQWLVNFCEYNNEILTIYDLDFSLDENIPFNIKTGTTLDALILWHPIEWLEDYTLGDGENLGKIFMKGLQEKSFALAHAIPAYFANTKGTLAYITEHAKELFRGKYKSAEKYFPKTYFSPKKLSNSYIAKPIGGRQGQDCYIVRNGKTTQSRMHNEFYANQKKIYQELLTIPEITVEEEPLKWVYESWVYRVDGRFVPGATSLRGCNREITDDFCYFMPIGI
jgi:glutathionylspermidine synthase